MVVVGVVVVGGGGHSAVPLQSGVLEFNQLEVESGDQSKPESGSRLKIRH